MHPSRRPKRNEIALPITINPDAPELPAGLADLAANVDVPTLGHFLEEGFVAPAICRQTGTGRLVGRAVTVRITADRLHTGAQGN